MNWTNYPNFKKEEFSCKHTGVCEMDEEFMNNLQALRTELDIPLIINSGYRDKTHPIEAAKDEPGEHFEGKAADIRCYGSLAYRVIALAPKHNFTRIGVSQKGPHNKRFIHLGTSTQRPHPTLWSY